VDAVSQDAWSAFGRRLRAARRGAGLTQAQLGACVGYHHTLISKLESGQREPGPGIVQRLDEQLATGGTLGRYLAEHAEVRIAVATPATFGLSMLTFPPGQEAPAPTIDLGAYWPASLPAAGVGCPLHPPASLTEHCSVPPAAEAMQGIAGLRRSPSGMPTRADPRWVHALAGLLAALAQASTADPGAQLVSTTEQVLRLVARWATAAHHGADGEALLRLAAGYAQLAGRLRMQRGQRVVAMSWLTHGLTWADALDDVPARASIITDVCTLVRLDDDIPSSIAYARALGAAARRRPWIMTLAHTYEARGHGWAGDVTQCRQHVIAARRMLGRLGERDLVEAPWMGGDSGAVRVESAVGGALRDLAVATGDASLTRPAAHAIRRSLALLPARMRPTHLLLSLRLSDVLACAGELDAALDVLQPLLPELAGARRWTIDHEVLGLRRRLARWHDVPAVREVDSQLTAR
jgi:transcriptional regulator with XRE-family HTH domain